VKYNGAAHVEYGVNATHWKEAMTNASNAVPDLYLSAALSKKLQAARALLGDRLCTHPESRFKPTKWTLLDEWLAMRRATAASGGPSVGKALSR